MSNTDLRNISREGGKGKTENEGSTTVKPRQERDEKTTQSVKGAKSTMGKETGAAYPKWTTEELSCVL